MGFPDDEEYFDEQLADFELDGPLDGRRFEGCTFSRATLSEAVLRSCIFDECTFVRCDLTMAKLYDSRFRDVRFEHCKLMGVDFTAAYALGFAVGFEGCVLSYACFLGMGLADLQMVECTAEETVFDEADLRRACFRDTDLRGARFGSADLREADLTEATGYAVDPRHTKVTGTRMSIDGALRSAMLFGIDVPTL